MESRWQIRWLSDSAVPIVENAIDMALEPLGFRLEYIGRSPAGSEGAMRMVIHADDAVAWKRPLFETAAALEADVLSWEDGHPYEPPELLVMDGDGTLLQGETINELARLAGAYEEVSEITDGAMRGELDFSDALLKRVQLLRGVALSSLDSVRDALPVAPGADVALENLRELGCRQALFTGGFHFLADAVAEELGIERVVANRLEIVDGILTGELEGELIDGAAKATALLELCEEWSIPPGRTLCMGDGANDRYMLEAAGIAIGFEPHEAIYSVLDGALFGGDWRVLPELLDVD